MWVFLFFMAYILFAGGRLLMYQHKLFLYLQENHLEKWKELTTILGYGPGYLNSFRSLKFIYGKDYLDDPEVLRLKVVIRNSITYVFLGFMATFVVLLMYAILFVGKS